MEGPWSAARQQLQQLQALVSVSRLRLDVLHLRLRQHVLLVQERNDSFTHQQLPGQFQPVRPQQSSVDRIHDEPRADTTSVNSYQLIFYQLTPLFIWKTYRVVVKLPEKLQFPLCYCVRLETSQRNQRFTHANHSISHFTLNRSSNRVQDFNNCSTNLIQCIIIDHSLIRHTCNKPSITIF